MRKSESLKAGNRRSHRLAAAKPHPSLVPGEGAEAEGNPHGYTARIVFRDPGTGAKIPVNVGVALSEDCFVAWLKI